MSFIENVLRSWLAWGLLGIAFAMNFMYMPLGSLGLWLLVILTMVLAYYQSTERSKLLATRAKKHPIK